MGYAITISSHFGVKKSRYLDAKLTTNSDDHKPASNETSTSSSTAKRVKNKKRREAQQEFTHSWMVGALKGHAAPVLDMDYSSNGKFLASCAEDCDLAPEELDPGGGGGGGGDGDEEVTGGPRSECPLLAQPSRKLGGKETAQVQTPVKRERAILSRRQRKNRTRTPRDVVSQRTCNNGNNNSNNSGNSSGVDTSNSSPSNTPPGVRRNRGPNAPASLKETANGSNAGTGGNNGGNKVSSSKSRKSRNSNGGARERNGASKIHQKLNLSDAVIAALMRRYVLRADQLVDMGYPVEGDFCPGRAVIFKDGFNFRQLQQNLDANAREFVPDVGKSYSEISASWKAERAERSELSGDSGHCSVSSLESSDGEPESSDCSDKASDIADGTDSSSSSSSSDSFAGSLERTCARCYRGFNVSPETGEYLSKERCVYHWGKLHDREWLCCGGVDVSKGCSYAKMHVWSGLVNGINGPFEGYVRTKPRKTPPNDSCYGIYAVDCEMCYTLNGLELAKVTVVGIDGRLVYDTLVKPEAEVIDYNTRFSGITAKDLSKSHKTLRDVQSDLMGFLNADTILIGHGLENDLKALRILHTTCVDTVISFPHYLGLPYRRSLKSLARSLLRRDIQTGHHDSLEDARTAAELMLWRLIRDLS
ncbi:uncharacterized protein LOC105687332 isoform X2 [Athalia rosae]|uniref:uncharacterized protein LOC105687332 isoform X2 n=1 Tax=Athalia rosae TaxID=37344 RepID=UPI0020341042|nr:uncharacterized protein LOC105687332 isoform X2 [Athalia rosae]